MLNVFKHKVMSMVDNLGKDFLHIHTSEERTTTKKKEAATDTYKGERERA